MNFTLSEEQMAIKEMASKFAQKEVAPLSRLLEEKKEFSWDLTRKMAELGFLGMVVPEEYGGTGLGTLTYVLALEEITRADLAQAMTMSLHNSLLAHPFLAYGTEGQKEKFLTPLATGEKLGAYALTEPNAGSEAYNLDTTAKLDGDFYVIDGNKIFVTNGAVADLIIVFACTEKAKGKKGVSAFVVEKETPGFAVTRNEEKMGIQASPTSSLSLSGCRVPRENLLGQEGQGYEIALSTLHGGRIGVGALAVGLAQAALEAAVRYSKERRQFGRAICEFQAIQFMLADMSMEIEAARLLTYKAAWLKDQGLPHAKEAAHAKLFASEMVTRVTHKAVQIFGGYGYTKDFLVEKYYREARATELYEGTSEIQRIVIAHSVLKEFP